MFYILRLIQHLLLQEEIPGGEICDSAGSTGTIQTSQPEDSMFAERGSNRRQLGASLTLASQLDFDLPAYLT